MKLIRVPASDLTARDLGVPGWDIETADGCVDAYQAVYIALWMRDYRLLPDEKLTFSNELTFSSHSRSASLIFTVVNLLIFGSPPAIDT